MRIVITGVNGFVGKHLFNHLIQSNEVYGIYNSGEPLSDNCFKVDLTDETATRKLFKEKFKQNIDTLIHLASRMASIKNADDTSLLTQNASISKNIAIASLENNIKHVINFSSSSVYPNIDGLFKETSIINPSPNTDYIYGLSKYNSEIILSFFLDSTAVILTQLRVAMIYGQGMDKTRIIPVLENELTKKNSLTLYGNGARILNLVSITALIKYVTFFIDHPLNDVVNIAEESITLKDLAKRIVDEKGNPSTTFQFKPQGNKFKFILDVSKLADLINN